MAGAAASPPTWPDAFAGVRFAVLTGVEVRPRFVSTDFAVTEWRCHEAAHSVSGAKQQPWHVLAFVHSGSFRLRCPRGRGVADPAEVVLFRPGEPYETAHTERCGDRGSAIALSPAMADELKRRLSSKQAGDPWRSPLRPVDAAAMARQFDVLRRLASGAARHDAGRIEIEELLLDLVTRILAPAGVPRSPASALTRERVATAQELLERRFHEPLRLDEIARQVESSPYHLCREFRRHTGWTIHRYLTHLRIAAGLERLVSTPRGSLLDLALELGFDGHSHFSDVFRRQVGCTPSAFRAAH